jgi:glycosyltransferase involved in cell wall biosynthesis
MFVGVNANMNLDEIQLPNCVSLGRRTDSGVLATFRFYFRLRQICKEFAPTLTLVNCEIAEFFSIVMPKGDICVIEHTSRPWQGRKTLGVLVRLVLWIRHAQWVTVNKDQHRIWPLRQICHFIANPIQKSEPRIKKNFDVVFVGRLNDLKHPGMVAQLGCELPIRAVLVGDGPLFHELHQKAQGKQILLTGFLDDPWREIGGDDLVVFPSEYEGDGRTVAEAIIRGNPILLRDNPDLRRFYLNENAYFSSYETLRRKTEDYLERGPDVYRPSSSTRTRLEEERSPDFVGERWLRFIAHTFGNSLTRRNVWNSQNEG